MRHFVTAAASFRVDSDDRAVAFPLGTDWVVCVADGTGGAAGAAAAAAMFVDSAQGTVRGGAFSLGEPAAWVRLLEDIDREIARHPAAGETTGIALAVTGGAVVGASAGDSRAWVFGAGATELTGDQVRKPRLGTGRAQPRSFSAPASGTLVVGTDGLFDHAALADIAAIAQAPPSADAGNALIGLLRARYRQLPDDVAVVIGWLDAG